MWHSLIRVCLFSWCLWKKMTGYIKWKCLLQDCKTSKLVFSTEISLHVHFYLMRCCQTVCNFIPSLCSIWPIPILIIQYFSGWLSQFPPLFFFFFADINVNLVYFHHYLLLKCSLLNPSVLEVVPSSFVSPKHSVSVITLIFFSRLIYLRFLSPSELEPLPPPMVGLFLLSCRSWC